jgi:hypothetical protein
MLIDLGYQLYINACFGNYLGNIFLLFFLSFSDFLVKRPDGKVDSSGRPFSLSGRACLCDFLGGTTSGRHLSYVRTVNPVGLYRIPPAPQPPHFIFLASFIVLCVFFFPCFLCVLLTCACPICNLSPIQVCFSTLLLYYFKFLCLK